MRNAVIAAAVLGVSAAGGAAYALGAGASAGEATVRTAAATGAAAKACAANTAFPKRQLRGVWIATVHNVDWPSDTGLSVNRQQAEYVKILDNAVRRNFNAVFVQVRPASDALYRSALEPWSQFLTGKAGKDPGWDPLPFLISEAHRRGLEFHAWFNPYRAAVGGDPAKLPASHPARLHPDWVVKHEGRLYYNPGLPAVRDHVTAVIKDVVSRYDVDGVHFDDYFYPYPGKGTKFADSVAYKRFGDGLSLADWRRENVNKLIAQVSATVHAVKPYVKFGISPFGIWRNKSEDPAGSNTQGMSAYSAIYADAKAWIKAGTVDYVIPQLYWPRGFKVADYDTLVKWWAGAVRGTRVDLYIGQALYRVGSKDTPAWTKPREMPSHLAFNKKFPEVKGDVYFSAANLNSNPLKVLDRLVKEHYSRPALVPLIQGMPARLPAAPRGLRVAAQGSALAWLPQADARAYAVYRTTPERAACATADSRDLVALIPAGASPAYVTSAAGVYQVTALDRLSNESAPTQLVVNAAR